MAALAVVFFHAREVTWIGISAMWHANKLAPNLNALLGYLTFPVIFGWAAVPLFFVLSGLWSISARGETFWSRRGQLLARVGTVSFSLYAFHYPFIL